MPSDTSSRRDPSRKTAVQAAAEAMRSHALRYPEAHEDFPWEGDRALKVRGKVFVFMGMAPDALSFSVKLPRSRDIALMLPFARPTGYGLGKSGWVSARFEAGDEPPVDMLLAWVDESYRAIAPKRLVAGLDASQAGAATEDAEPATPTRKKATKATKAAAPARKKVPKAAKAAAPTRKASRKTPG